MSRGRAVAVSSLAGLLSIAAPGLTRALPVHPHGDVWTAWEADGDTGGTRLDHAHPAPGSAEQGDTAHQHYLASGFRGWNDEGEPFSAYGAWNDRTALVDRDAPFADRSEYQTGLLPHGYIRQSAQPRYLFDGDWSSAPAQSAQARVVDAFDLWGNIRAERSPVTNQMLRTGIGFSHVTSGAHEVRVSWLDLSDSLGGGRITGVSNGFHGDLNPLALEFDSSFDWDFTSDGSAAAADQWHFFSVALHEVGHALLFEHQLDGDVMDPSVGEPLDDDVDGDGRFWRWHGLVDGAGESDYLQGFTRAIGEAAWSEVHDQDSVDAVKSLYSIPIPEPAPVWLLALSSGALVGLRGRPRSR